MKRGTLRFKTGAILNHLALLEEGSNSAGVIRSRDWYHGGQVDWGRILL